MDELISRQAVNALVDELARAISDERCCISRGRSTATIMQDILDLPPVTPQRPKWIETGDVGYIEDTAIYEFQCSKCKSLAYFRKSFNEIVGGAFCSNCGADMRGDDNENDD